MSNEPNQQLLQLLQAFDEDSEDEDHQGSQKALGTDGQTHVNEAPLETMETSSGVFHLFPHSVTGLSYWCAPKTHYPG
jgi:hypothetical protein